RRGRGVSPPRRQARGQRPSAEPVRVLALGGDGAPASGTQVPGGADLPRLGATRPRCRERAARARGAVGRVGLSPPSTAPRRPGRRSGLARPLPLEPAPAEEGAKRPRVV